MTPEQPDSRQESPLATRNGPRHSAEMNTDQQRKLIAFLAAGGFSVSWWIAQPHLDELLSGAAKLAILLVGVSAFIIFGLIWLATLVREEPKERTDPAPDWIPLHMAPFKLAPSKTYGPLTPGWMPLLLEASLPGAPDPMPRVLIPRVAGVATESQVRDLNGYAPHVQYDWPRGGFWISYEGPKGGWGRLIFPCDLTPDHRPDQLSPEVWDRVRASFEIAWKGVLMGGLSDLIAAGHVRVQARFGSAKEPFTPLNADAWQHFQITDLNAGRATGEGNDRLFSIHIEPLPVSEAAKRRAAEHPFGEP